MLVATVCLQALYESYIYKLQWGPKKAFFSSFSETVVRAMIKHCTTYRPYFEAMAAVYEHMSGQEREKLTKNMALMGKQETSWKHVLRIGQFVYVLHLLL